MRETVWNKRIRENVDIDKIQYDFVSGRRNVEAVFLSWRPTETKY